VYHIAPPSRPLPSGNETFHTTPVTGQLDQDTSTSLTLVFPRPPHPTLPHALLRLLVKSTYIIPRATSNSLAHFIAIFFWCSAYLSPQLAPLNRIPNQPSFPHCITSHSYQINYTTPPYAVLTSCLICTTITKESGLFITDLILFLLLFHFAGTLRSSLWVSAPKTFLIFFHTFSFPHSFPPSTFVLHCFDNVDDLCIKYSPVVYNILQS